MKIAVNVVSFNRKDLLENCLNDLFKFKHQNILEIWVVDNASGDGSVELVEKNFPQVKLIKNTQNIGFGKAHNQVLNRSDADLFILLNPDTKIQPNTIDSMVGYIEGEKDCGIASCRLIYPDGSTQSNGGDLPSGIALISWLLNLETLGILPNFHRLDKGYFIAPHEVGWVGGTFMVIKREVVDKIGLLDEDIFMYFEDTDYCYRARKEGFKIMINPQITIEHIGGASSQDPRFRQWSGEFRGLVYFYKKHYGILASFLIRLASYISITLRVIAFLVTGKLELALTYVRVAGSF